MRRTQEIRYEGLDCVLTVKRAAHGVVVVTLSGRDRGELGGAPFRAIENEIAAAGTIELFMDARAERTASLNVGPEWARWLAANAKRLRHVSLLFGSRFIQLGDEFVRDFGDLGPLVRMYCDPVAFDAALENSTANQRLEAPRAAS